MNVSSLRSRAAAPIPAFDYQQAAVHSSPKSIAFFDIDRTLLTSNSLMVGLRHMWHQRRVMMNELLSLALVSGLVSIYLTRIPIVARGLHVQHLHLSLASIQSLGSAWFWDSLAASISPKAIQRIREHKEKGDVVMLLSASTQFVAGFIAEYLDILYHCTVLRVVNDHLTGETIGGICYGAGKLRRAHAVAASLQIPLSQCTFYSDSYSDRDLLKYVGRPIVVNPDWRLQILAKHKGWDVIRL